MFSKEKVVFRSIIDFEKKYFPNTFGKKMAEKPKDNQAIGISMAKDSMDIIKKQLTQ